MKISEIIEWIDQIWLEKEEARCNWKPTNNYRSRFGLILEDDSYEDEEK